MQLLLHWEMAEASRSTVPRTSSGGAGELAPRDAAPLVPYSSAMSLGPQGYKGMRSASISQPLLLLLQHGLLRQDCYEQFLSSSRCSAASFGAESGDSGKDLQGHDGSRSHGQQVSVSGTCLASTGGGVECGEARSSCDQLMLYELLIACCRSASHTTVLRGLLSAAEEEQQLETKLQGWAQVVAALRLQLQEERVQGCFVIMGLYDVVGELGRLEQQLDGVQVLPACAAVKQQWSELVDLVAWAWSGVQVRVGPALACCAWECTDTSCHLSV